MITIKGIGGLADYAGIKEKVAKVTEAAMRGELEFVGALDARGKLLGGLEAAMIDRCREERVKIMPGAKALVRTMKANGARAVLVSGGFTVFADEVARDIGFDRAIRSEEHTSELQSLMRISYAVFCLKKKKQKQSTL